MKKSLITGIFSCAVAFSVLGATNTAEASSLNKSTNPVIVNSPDLVQSSDQLFIDSYMVKFSGSPTQYYYYNNGTYRGYLSIQDHYRRVNIE